MRRLVLLILSCLLSSPVFADTPAQAAAWWDKFFESLAPRETIDTNMLGVNAFANDGRFGGIGEQFNEVKNELGLKYIRILMNWDDAVQPTPSSKVNFAFYDELIKNIPAGVEAVVVLAGIPSWMNDSNNWIDGDPRKTFALRWVKKVAKRYGRKNKLKAIQIWNEPNDVNNEDNIRLELSSSPQNYVELLRASSNEVRRYAKKKKKIVAAATTAINQNFPESLDYNRDMHSAGLKDIADVVALHYYGAQYERIYFGIGEFIDSIDKTIWFTESGARGVLKQLEYAERTWPLLKSLSPRVERIYAYQFTDASAADESWGLRTLDPEFPISDLYLHLRDRN